ncbi:MAG TPA: hypothetical protein VF017_17480 [Thermoanaerobaculia bacterium]|nr:hypothetical protein [Thermoanaerobaculia bacterium]
MANEKTGQPKKSIKEIFLEGTLIDEALRKATRQAVLEHKREGLPMAVLKDGKEVWVPAQELEVPE